LLQVSMHHMCTCNNKRNKLAEKQRNKHKESMLKEKLPKKESQTGANKHVIKQKGCPRRTNAGLDRGP